MAIAIKEAFSVDAPVARVWRFLTTPQEVVQCIPGAELTGELGERQYAGRVKVKVGPVTAAYTGKATLARVDDGAREMTLVGEGRETGGAGTARMTLQGSVSPNATGGSDVRVDATIDIAGKVMQFGRGLVESVSAQLFKQFVADARARLEAESARGGSGAPEAPPAGAAAPVPPRELRLLPLLWRALTERLRRLFVRRPRP
jgi:hypothetical protein